MSSKFIEDYSFGEIIIDGKRYTDDVILLGREVRSGWWRNRGHRVVEGDLESVKKYDPELLIIGTGSSGRVTVPSSLENDLDFEMVSYPTKRACKRYNKELEDDKKIAGGFHLTC